MQGLLSACAKVYYGGLTNKELLYCIGPKQVLLPNRFLYFKKKEYERRAVLERFVIQKLPYISVQSEWVRSHVELENPTCNISPTGILLRKEFYEAQAWTLINNINPIIFTITNCAFCYKGLHILFRAIAILKQKIPTIQLRIAGHIQKHKFIDDGYIRWLNKEAKRLGINDSIEWLDALDADGLIKQFHAASVVAFPSFVESYCLALAETMIVGVPTVVSYAGGMTEMARHNETALYFPVGDIVSCAWQIEKILKDKMLSEKLSQNARIAGLSRNNPDRVIKRQLEIYNKVIVETANNN
jgi:glycosyltransferase involved in cell wall biosynthesis